MKCHKIKYAAALLCVASVNANAALTSVANGLGVYDNGINATWTADANLLGTLEANAIAGGDTDAQNLITVIINASGGVIHDTPNYIDNGIYTLSAYDFTTTGAYQGIATWWGQQAFVHYLDTINYGGSNQWALPTTPDSSTSSGYNQSSSQLGELYTNELKLGPGGIFGDYSYGGQKNIGSFTNVQAYAYWSGTEYSGYPILAWSFYAYYGLQDGNGKNNQLYAWAVSPGQVNAVPVPGAVWLFGTGILGLLGLKRRVHAG